jgi:hypothetical protein
MKKFVILCILITILLIAHELKAVCLHPDLDVFLESSRAVINFQGSHFPSPTGVWLEMNTDGKSIQWLGVTWWGPEDGALFVLDCLGNLITGLGIGAVSSLSRFSQNLNLKNAAIVEYTSNTGTGYRLRKVAIFNFDNSKVNKIWEHDLYESIFVFPDEDGTEKEYILEVSPDGNKIKVIGNITTYHPPWDWKVKAATKVKTLIEIYCWDNAGTYMQCN